MRSFFIALPMILCGCGTIHEPQQMAGSDGMLREPVGYMLVGPPPVEDANSPIGRIEAIPVYGHRSPGGRRN